MKASAILLHAAAESLEPALGPANYAIGLAAAFDAHLTALVLRLDVALPQNATFEARNRDALQRAELLRRRAASLGVPVEILTDHSHAYTVPRVVVDHARLCDVAVAGVSEAGLLSERMIAEYVLFESGRPLIVVPQRHDAAFACERVTIAWDFERTAARALSDALPLLRGAAEVTLVTVDSDNAIDSSLTSAQVLASLHRRGVAARFEKIGRRGQSIGDAIQDFAIRRSSHLLVMGGYGHSRFRDFVLGGATRQILGSPRLPTLLSH